MFNIIFDFTLANYNEIIYDLGRLNWVDILNPSSTEESANFIQPSLLESIQKWVPLHKFRK